MVRISGVNLPQKKHVFIALTYIYGIGRSTASQICADSDLDPTKIVSDLTDRDIEKVRQCISRLLVEADLRREVSFSIKRLVDMGCYRGIRHKKSLPVRGQRTRTNARTRKGSKSSK